MPAWNASDGGVGTSLTGLAIPVSSILTGSGSTLSVGSLPLDTLFLCELQDYTFSIGAIADSFQWQIDTTGTWENLVPGTHFANVDTNETFLILNVDQSVEGWYRLMVFNAYFLG
jgi:hypothetical protein